tara:strand:- start:621 stop:794 length:174 start_codon:yes stop_codon:yes gene_type:complete
MKMSKTVVIYLDFEDDDIDDRRKPSPSRVEVYNYLNELMENECLDWEIKDEQDDVAN